jgi:hypothetical protein
MDTTDSNYDKPMSSYPWTTDLATTLSAAHDVFRGVSNVRRIAAQLADGGREQGVIFLDGEFAFPCDALGSAAKPGDLVTFAKQAGNALEAQKVVITTTIGHAIGRVQEAAAVGATTLIFNLEPALFAGGAQAIT